MKIYSTAPSVDNDHGHAWEQTISAWVDGQEEIRPDELDSPYGRQVWDTYHLIGDVLRSDELAITPSDLFYARLSRQIDSEPAIVARPARRSLTRVGGTGLAVVALASLAWLFTPSLGGYSSDDSPSLLLVVSGDQPQNEVSDYIEAHRELTGFNVLREVAYNGGVLHQ